MIIDIVWLLVGLVLILGGSSALTDGAASIARKIGISDLIVGLTIVALGTSAPELVISVVSAAKDSPGLAVGNVVGSNIFNILAIIGVVSIVRPIKIGGTLMCNEIPLVILSSLLLLVIGNGPMLNGTSGEAMVSRPEGIILLFFLCIFMRYVIAKAHGARPEPNKADQPKDKASVKEMPALKSTVYVAAGLAALIFGGDRFVAGASGIASSLGVSEAVIGLTIVAAGTSLPELATSVAAALKGQPGIALGNVIGSNIYNVFFVLGTAAVVRPLPFSGINNFDLLVLTGASIIFWIFGWIIGHRTITRSEGAFLVACYVAYIWILVAQVS